MSQNVESGHVEDLAQAGEPTDPKILSETGTASPSTEKAFDHQKRLFQEIPDSERDRYYGRFVVSRDGAIVDDDADLATLTDRFFGRYGRVQVYITRVGKPARMSSPMVKR
ncbi:MAG TPA: hypothetical protein VI756_11855 [Blastocatellia bacterium]